MLTGANKAKRRLLPLEAALVVLRRDGPEQLSTRKVATEAGVTATALYRHFDSMDHLLRAVIREVYGLFRTYFVVAELPDTRLNLKLGFDRYLHFALEHRNYYRLLFAFPHRLGIDRYPEDFRSGGAAGFRQLRDIVTRAMNDGVLRKDEPGDVALTIYAHMHGLVMLHFTGRFNDDDQLFQTFFHRSMDHLVTGLG